MTGKVVPEEAVLEMKLNYSLPSESDPHVDEIVWVEQPRDKSEVLVQMWVRVIVTYHCYHRSIGQSMCTAFTRLLQSPGFSWLYNFQDLERVLKNDFGPGKSWKFKFKVLKFAGMWTQWCGRGRENIPVRTPLVLVICSYVDKTFFFTTCDSDEHCSMDATVTLLYVE